MIFSGSLVLPKLLKWRGTISLFQFCKIDDYAEDGVPGRSELYIVLTIILFGTNFLIW